MINSRPNPQGFQRPNAANPGDDFLSNSRSVVAAVESACQLPILLLVFFKVGVEEQKPDAAYVKLPNFGVNRPASGLDFDGNFVAFLVSCTFQGKKLDGRVDVLFLLPAFDIEVLFEISLVIKQSDGNERHAEAACTFDMVAGEDAEAAGVDRHRLVNAEFQRKIGDGLGAENADVSPCPSGSGGHILGHSAVCLVDSGIEDEFRGTDFQSFGSEFVEESDGIVPELSPSDGIERAEEADDFGMPTPPEIIGKSDAFAVESLGGDTNEFSGGLGRRVVICSHSVCILSKTWRAL